MSVSDVVELISEIAPGDRELAKFLAASWFSVLLFCSSLISD